MKLDIRYIETQALVPYARNAKTHPPEQIAQIAGSLREFGFINPVIVDKDRSIVAGHGRVLAAQKLGLTEVPTIAAEHLTPTQVKAFRLADNRIAQNGSWDDDLLKIELEELDNLGVDLEGLGFDIDELPGECAEGSGGDDLYTKKILAPIYEPKEATPPPISTLYDPTKADSLLKEIDSAAVPDDVKAFLRCAADRHTVFDYEQIAEYYAHAPKDVQALMEKSALVIIDFEKAIEGGFVALAEALAESYKNDDE